MNIFQPNKDCFLLLICFCFISFSYGQQTGFKGRIVDAFTNKTLSGVVIVIKETLVTTQTNSLGEFDFETLSLPLGEQIAVISKKGYVTKRFPIIINQGVILNLSTIDLAYDFSQEHMEINTISLSDNELDDSDDISSYHLSGLLQASKDIFMRAAAFDFSTTFFRPRGFGNENGKVLINGIEMNKLSTGRPQWSNWGGLNNVQRNKESSLGIAASEYMFGGLSGVTNITMRASQYRKSSSISYASSNRSYTGRVMGSYHSGLMANGWAYSISLSRRYGKEGLIDGTLYDANSVFISVEKKINNAHSLNFSNFYTPNRRGMSTAITEEIFRLKGREYNPNWGYHNGQKKNSRIRTVEEPVLMMNHYWDITDKTSLNTNISFQIGSIGSSRLDNGGTDLLSFNGQENYIGGGRSRDTNPMHPSNLPSYYVQDTRPAPLDFQNAFLAQQHFIADGQLDWDQLIEANQLNAQQGTNATYIWYQDRNDDTQSSFNTILNSQLSDHISMNGTIHYRSLTSRNYAEVLDLLGGTGFLDVDSFALNNSNVPLSEQLSMAQSDVQNRNRIVGVGDTYNYNYEIAASVFGGFLQTQIKTNRVDFFMSGKMSQTLYQRNGLFENGYFAGNKSLGKGSKLAFTNYGIKGGTTFKIDGHHLIDIHGTYFTKAPTIRHAYANVRQNNITVADLVGGDQKSEKIHSADVNYILRSPKLKLRLTGYYTKIKDATDIGFFYTNAISGSFVQEILTGVDKVHIGGELGVAYQITPTLQLKAAAALGQFTFDNNPALTLTSTSEGFTTIDENIEAVVPEPRSLGQAFLKNYHIPAGPQNAVQVGLEYRHPNFWWVGVTSNYFSNAYIDISPLKRTENFSIDPESGIPYNDYDPTIARTLLKQEQFGDYVLVNLVGGKSWRVKGYYIGFFATLNNVFDQQYKTGGFEQARNADYRTTLEESERDTPVFGSRYFYGYGTSYYLNLYVRF